MLTEDEAIELFAFLVTSARTQIDEPAHYAPMRLLSAAERLVDFASERAAPETREMMAATREAIARGHAHMNDREEFTKCVDEVCRIVAGYLVEKEGLE